MSIMAYIKMRIQRSQERGWIAPPESETATVPCLSFNDYMAICLYDEQYGYYRSGPLRIGREGDFYTSSGIGNVIARIIARYISQEHHNLRCIMEWGGGSGRFAAQLLQAWGEQNAAAPDPDMGNEQLLRYWFVEDHPAHIDSAKHLLQGLLPEEQLHYFTSTEAESRLRDTPVMLIANELLDAFPVHRVQRINGRDWELGVTWDEQRQQLAYCRMPLSKELQALMQRDGIGLQEQQIAELGRTAELWLKRMLLQLQGGCLLFIDYGDEALELTAAHRMNGTLLCYYNHQAYDDPFLRPGQADMTAHVNFSGIRAVAESCGWHVDYYNTQKQFLVDQGVLELLADHSLSDPFHPIARRNRAVRQLLISDGMSELFKVMVLRKQTK